MKRVCKTALSLIALAPSAALAQAPDPAALSIAAGYKAAFTCSATFNAGRTPEQIAGDELNRIYPDYREALAALPAAKIVRQTRKFAGSNEGSAVYRTDDTRYVSVAYDDAMPPRIALWRPALGCVQLPTGALLDDFKEALTAPQGLEAPGEITPLQKTAAAPPRLSSVVDKAFNRRSYGRGTETTAVIVVKDGAIIAERYRDGFDETTPQRTWSVAKSIAATIIGAAVHDGLIDVGDDRLLAAWSAPGDPRARITLENLLHMSSGLTSGAAGNRTDDVYFGGGRIIDHALSNRLVAEPGARWRYANNDTMAAMRALRERIGAGAAYRRFPFERVLHPLGMTRTFPETDWNGDFVLSSQVWTTARDLVRLGLLYLDDGVVDGRRILPEGWARYVTTPAPAQPARERGGRARPGYGAQWWLYGARHELPDGTYAARGNRGQYLFIIPERNMLVVRRGFDDNGGAQFDVEQFVRDVLAVTQ